MGSVARPARDKNVILDIDSELRYWSGSYACSRFHRTPRLFDDYLATLKFGYDMYLLHHRHDLGDVLPAIRDRYFASVHPRDQLDWPLAEAVIRETWKRMLPTSDRRPPGLASNTFPPSSRGNWELTSSGY